VVETSVTILIFASRSLNHAVEAHELMHDQLSHISSFPLRWLRLSPFLI
jgi:hypothetical protein